MRDKVKAGKDGWLSVKPDFFEDRDHLIQFMTGTKRQQLELLDGLIALEDSRE